MSRKLVGLALIASAFGLASLGLPGCNVVVGAGDYKVGTLGCSADGIAATMEPIVKACALFLGCSPFVPSISLSFCTTYNVPHSFSYFSCGLSAESCQDVFNCRGVSDANDGDCDGTNSARCEGSRALTCLSTMRKGGYFLNCDVLGGTCATYTNGTTPAVGCQVATCAGTSATYECSGENLYQCFSGVGIGQTCDASSTCTTKGSSTSCYANLPACPSDSITCVGDSVHVCSSGSLITYECGAAGQRCEATDKDASCLAPGCTTADASGCKESCDADGTTAVLCVGGAKLRVDCTKYGFSKCVSYDPSTSIKEPYVLCQL